MFVMFEKEEFKVPVRVWLEGPGVVGGELSGTGAPFGKASFFT